MEIDEWVNRIINGTGGFKSWEDHEIVIHNSREESIAAFVVRCLANPACEGSKEVLDLIAENRHRLSNTPESWPSRIPVSKLPATDEIEAKIKELATQSTAPDKETPDWLEADIRRGMLWMLNRIVSNPA